MDFIWLMWFEYYVPIWTYIWIWIVVFILWTAIWSFYSVVSHRLKIKKAWIINWRSECPHCWHRLWAKDLVPIASYLMLKWKCRYCHTKIWIHYLFYEMIAWSIALFIYILICIFTNWIFILSYNLWIHWMKAPEEMTSQDIKQNIMNEWNVEVVEKQKEQTFYNPPAPMNPEDYTVEPNFE